MHTNYLSIVDEWRTSYGYFLSFTVKYFDSEEEMFSYVESDDYEKDDNIRGLCAGISYYSEDGGNTHHFKFHFDDQSKSNDNQNIPSQMNPPYDKFERNIDLDSYKMYAEGGFNMF